MGRGGRESTMKVKYVKEFVMDWGVQTVLGG